MRKPLTTEAEGGDHPIGQPSLSVAPQEREYLRGPLGRLLERRPVTAVVEQHEVSIGDVG